MLSINKEKPFVIQRDPDPRSKILPLIVKPLLDVLNADPSKITERRFGRGGGWEGWLQHEYQDHIENTFRQGQNINVHVTTEEEIATGVKPDVLIRLADQQSLHGYGSHVIELKCQSSYGASYAKSNFLQNILVDQRSIISCTGKLDAHPLLRPYSDYKNGGSILFWSLAVHGDPTTAEKYATALGDLVTVPQKPTWDALQVGLAKETKFCTLKGLRDHNINVGKTLYPCGVWIACVDGQGEVPSWWDQYGKDIKEAVDPTRMQLEN